MPNTHISLPASAEGERLQLSAETEEMCKVVYKLKDNATAEFYELWDPDFEYSDEYIIVPVRSTYGGLTSEYDVGKKFANVLKSSRPKPDPKPPGYSSWIKLLEIEYGKDPAGYDSSSCCAKSKIYDSTTKAEKLDFVCGTLALGGHIVWGEYAQSSAEGSTVYLLPICGHHNTSKLNSEKTGDGYYMELNRKMKAAILNRFLELPSGSLD